MYQTIQLSSCVSVQGEFVELLANGEVVIRDGASVYRGQPIHRGETGKMPEELVRALEFGSRLAN